MAVTQFDIIRRQAESAAKNAASRAAAGLRRETSLVNRASQLTGRAVRAGEAAVKRKRARRPAPAGQTVAADRPRPRQAADGYVRRSPVQPIHEAADYRARRIRRAVGTAALVVLLCAAVVMLNRLGVFAR